MSQNRPRLLDLFCGAGGGAVGYSRAGFDVVGVDNRPQKHFPFPFVLGNAIAALDVLLCGGAIVDNMGREWRLSDFSAIHASPPCQGESVMRNLPWLRDKDYVALIEPTRELLNWTGLHYMIENVGGARYRAGRKEYGLQAAYLCGSMFSKSFYRHRYFETNWFWMQPGHPRHAATISAGRMLGGRAATPVTPHPGVGIGHAAGIGLFREAMEIDWMIREELTEALPPVYTSYLGSRLMEVLA